jgi:hypothetical protein
MRVQIGRFSRVASVRVLPDRRSCAFCGGQFSTVTLQKRASARSQRNPLPSPRTTRTGELDGTKEADGG